MLRSAEGEGLVVLLPDVNPWWIIGGGLLFYAALRQAGWIGGLVAIAAFALAAILYAEVQHKRHHIE